MIRIGDSEEADDLTRRVFIKFYRNLNNWQDKGYRPSAYLYTIARSVIANCIRKKGRDGSKLANSRRYYALVGNTSQNRMQTLYKQKK